MVAAMPGVNYAALYIKPLELEKDKQIQRIYVPRHYCLLFK